MRLAGVISGLAAGAALVLAGFGVAAQAIDFTPLPPVPGIKDMVPLSAGSAAPPFKIKDTNGQDYDFGAEMKKRAHLLVFWSVYCEPCLEEMPVIERIALEHRAAGDLEVLAFNMDGAPLLERIRLYLDEYKYSVRVLLDEVKEDGSATSDLYQVEGTPSIYLVDANGKVYSHHFGRIGEADLKALVAAMLETP